MRSQIKWWASGLCVVMLLWSTTASAQASVAAQETTIHGGTLVMATYIVLWLLFGGYLFAIMRRQRTLQREIEHLDGRLDEVLGEQPK